MLKFGVAQSITTLLLKFGCSIWVRLATSHVLFLISSCPEEFLLPSTKKNRAWSKLIHFIVNELSLHSAETDNRLISAGILNTVLFNLSYWCTVSSLDYPRELSPTRERDNKLDLKILTLYSHLFFGGWSLTFIRSSPSLMRWPKFTSWMSWREKNAPETNTLRLKWSKLLLDLVISETHKGLKCVSLICLLCPMLIRIHFQK